MASDARRVEIGFDGGQVVSVRLNDDAFTELRKAVDGADGWRDLETAEGTFAVDLSKVVFIRAAGGSHAIGFAGD